MVSKPGITEKKKQIFPITQSLDGAGAEGIQVVVEPRHGWLSLGLGELWRYRELLYFLTWRDIKVRYKQTLLGILWAILQPVMTMVVFSVIFGNLAKLPSEGFPYPIFTFTALLPWQLFAFALTSSSNSLINNQNLITKVYFPRLIIPIASVLVGVVDFAISLLILIGFLIYYHIPFTFRFLTLPFFVLMAIASSLAVGLWLAALNVKYRDVRYMVPFITQFWMYATPVAFSLELIPQKWRYLVSLNPMTGVVEGFRWAILGKTSDILSLLLISGGVVVALLIGGLIYFRRMEDEFADII
jgi:lipopolysaccharide transport system permease protein